MANRSKLQTGHRRHYDATPEELRDKLEDWEASVRYAKVEELHHAADATSHPETARGLISLAHKHRDAMPYKEFEEKRKTLGDAWSESLEQPGDSQDQKDIRNGLREAIHKLEDEHRYPDGIRGAKQRYEVEQRAREAGLIKAQRRAVSRRDGFCPWCDQELWRHEAAGHYRNHEKNDARADVKAKVGKAMAEWQADHDARVAQLRRDIEAFKRQHEEYVRGTR